MIYNPIKVELEELKSAVSAEPGSFGWDLEWIPTSEEDPGQGMAQSALDLGARMVVAVGGDGTVRAIAEVLRGTKVRLALLPVGTGNLLARNLTLTLQDTAHSLATAFNGSTRQIDVAGIEIRRPDGEVNRHAFLVMAGAGLDAKIMSNTDPELKKRIGWLAYAHALIGVSRDKTMLRLTYKLDSHAKRRVRAQSIVIGNCGLLPANIVLLPDAVLDDGLLDVIVLKPESFRGWVAVMFTILWEHGVVKRFRTERQLTQLKSESIDLHQCTTLDVTLSRPEEVELDGDPFGEMVGCRVTVEPGALAIMVPLDEASEGRSSDTARPRASHG